MKTRKQGTANFMRELKIKSMHNHYQEAVLLSSYRLLQSDNKNSSAAVSRGCEYITT